MNCVTMLHVYQLLMERLKLLVKNYLGPKVCVWTCFNTAAFH